MSFLQPCDSASSPRQNEKCLSLNAFDVVGRKHSPHPGSLDRAKHPALVDRLHVHHEVILTEPYFIIVLRVVVIHCLVHWTLADTHMQTPLNQ